MEGEGGEGEVKMEGQGGEGEVKVEGQEGEGQGVQWQLRKLEEKVL